MMKMALKIENREMVRKECGLSSALSGNQQFKYNSAKIPSTTTTLQKQSEEVRPMRTITLKGVTQTKNERTALRNAFPMPNFNQEGRRDCASSAIRSIMWDIDVR